MKQIVSIFSSMKTMAVLMLIFAFAIGYATFVENDYGTITAKADIYNAFWFELLIALLSINLIMNIFKYKMFSINKAPIFIFHLSFIIIVLGAAITRFVGFEGTMHIREGDVATTMLSSDTYFSVSANVGDKTKETSQTLYLSKKNKNSLSSSLNIEGKDVHVELIDYIPDAIESLVEGKEGGFEAIEMMIAQNESSMPIKLKKGEYYENDVIALNFGSDKMFLKPVVSIFSEDGKLYMKHEMPLKFLKMDDRTEGEVAPSDKNKLEGRTLFGVEGTSFIVRGFYQHATTKIISDPNASPMRPQTDALTFNIKVGDVSENVMIFAQAGRAAKESHNVINGVDVHVSYGSKKIEIPFGVKLIDFQLDRYPGSMSPASYASEVELIDEEKNIHMPYRIFMNNILEHRGYRFFQSSYDQDEQGTILSVNNDPGTLPSYIGYFLLGLGMFWSLFSKKNRFAQLSSRAKKASEQKAVGILLSLGLLFSITPSYADNINPTIKTVLSFDKEHAKKFGELIIQDSGGRMKPLDTLSTEILAKIHRGSFIKIGEEKLTPNQVILGMMVKPDAYRELKIIRTKNEEINKMIGVESDSKYASFSQFFTNPEHLDGYKLAEAVDNAIRKEPKHRDLFDKAVLEIDERVNISYSVYSGALIKIWPKPNDVNNKWYPTIEALQTFDPQNSQKVRTVVFEYFAAVDAAVSSGNWSKANSEIEKIYEYQAFYGHSVLPSETRIKAETFYNYANIFERIYPLYLLLGFILLIFSFVKILKPEFNIAMFSKISLGLLTLLFLTHTFGIAIRWYIAGHAPWSDGYESMIYISWATVLAGFIFSKRSSMTMASTAVLTGLILFVAHLNWMNPQVTNLVPVLNSYWLSIHVAVITASYGFLGLGALLGFITILLFILKNEKNQAHISLSIKELNAINEMSLMIGLAFLTLGNFLGGVWANESWGRYWGWDPKETWALVTILVYAVVVHLRFIKSIYSEFNYSVISLLSYTSVIMTYFGVNYYLAGMHSYAKGDPVPIPDFVPITYTILFVVIAIASRNRKLA
ncbi:MAG: cytochrome C biogenesis protein [Sulfurimonas sp. RIFOXYD12_FULL_33_39]|uniref:cytochrome c biogenesis protein CcsA n=1 Tax=unclassified Sulfurimonas TaxID=2623549 RepID=UPI0008D328FA|nr:MULTISPECIES: cytochrome c biogenesis protein CcsA [unclassified Sulfurimonas]OHE09991.1 MAG: cytochrome C biogenesis protein [Sulfurimonas sp. RIFOXYD12_FULL_33_39]OHE14789.1 MAG: cytochrome C biogenesis protein [Sulfurimonas sp. RIFOXYD2_FULL_34_21]DAB28828.1 MAG TPA: cytochrome C biogenesis protein [Sulfurimonas sp. UBA10385]